MSILVVVFLWPAQRPAGWLPAGQTGRQCVSTSSTLREECLPDSFLNQTENQMSRSKAQWSALREWMVSWSNYNHFFQRRMVLLEHPLNTGHNPEPQQQWVPCLEWVWRCKAKSCSEIRRYHSAEGEFYNRSWRGSMWQFVVNLCIQSLFLMAICERTGTWHGSWDPLSVAYKPVDGLLKLFIVVGLWISYWRTQFSSTVQQMWLDLLLWCLSGVCSNVLHVGYCNEKKQNNNKNQFFKERVLSVLFFFK